MINLIYHIDGNEKLVEDENLNAALQELGWFAHPVERDKAKEKANEKANESINEQRLHDASGKRISNRKKSPKNV